MHVYLHIHHRDGHSFQLSQYIIAPCNTTEDASYTTWNGSLMAVCACSWIKHLAKGDRYMQQMKSINRSMTTDTLRVSRGQTTMMSEHSHWQWSQAETVPATMMHVTTGVNSRDKASASTPPTDLVSPNLANSLTNCIARQHM